MRTVRSAQRYAKALLEIAIEQKSEDQVKADMDTLLSALNQSRELRNLMLSPVVKADQKVVIMEKVFGSHISELSMRFLQLLARKHREMFLREMAAAYSAAWRVHKGVKQLQITSAHPLTEAQRNEMIAKAKEWANSDIEIEERINPDLIGGFVMRLDDKQIDASVASQLKELRSSFSNNLYIPEL